jgi:hypothetical protein
MHCPARRLKPASFRELADRILSAPEGEPLTLDAAYEPEDRYDALCTAIDASYPDVKDGAERELRTLREDENVNALRFIREQTAFAFGRHVGRAESANRATALELFVDVLQSQETLPNLTERSTDVLRRQVRAIGPYLPAIVTMGQWDDWIAGPVEQAVSAAADVSKRSTLHVDDSIRERDALYLAGILIGLSLAAALQGAKVQL